ncbi:hypothetical protein J3R30DRAFT_3698479 [Lentinula aciculospora]|uniref:Uncharacterized protein n=1 Tax=Lentinula aciculospora TaxID=153920 RepID=A0A9W9DSU6_9AGAR|nr:hypothetical protein J3R30DRAFT_3698479 [Lentinula aciculospora]
MTTTIVGVNASPINPASPATVSPVALTPRPHIQPGNLLVGYLWVPKEEALKLNQNRVFPISTKYHISSIDRQPSDAPENGKEDNWLCTITMDGGTDEADRLLSMPATPANPPAEAKKLPVEPEKHDFATTTSTVGNVRATDFPMSRLRKKELHVSCADPSQAKTVNVNKAVAPLFDMEAFGPQKI